MSQTENLVTLTADHMMRNATLRTESNRGKSGEASKNPEVVSNKQQFEDWLAAGTTTTVIVPASGKDAMDTRPT